MLGETGNRMCMMVHERWAVVSGGFMANLTLQVPYGVDGYLCLIMSFRPDIAWEYFDAVKAGKYEKSWRMIREVEYPLRDLLTSFGVSINSVWHGISEVFGISGRYLPLPYYSLTDEQLEKQGCPCPAAGDAPSRSIDLRSTEFAQERPPPPDTP